MSTDKERLRYTYLGDAVYAEKLEDGTIILRTSSPRDYECDNKIYLKPKVLKKLLSIANNINEKSK